MGKYEITLKQTQKMINWLSDIPFHSGAKLITVLEKL